MRTGTTTSRALLVCFSLGMLALAGCGDSYGSLLDKEASECSSLTDAAVGIACHHRYQASETRVVQENSKRFGVTPSVGWDGYQRAMVQSDIDRSTPAGYYAPDIISPSD